MIDLISDGFICCQMASDEGMLTDGQWKKLEVATLKNADNLSSSPKSHPLFADLNIKSPTGGKGPVAGLPFRHVRRTHSGKHIRVKKGLNFMKPSSCLIHG